MIVVFSSEAFTDLRRIREYISLDNPLAASQLAAELVSTCDRLEFFSERGRPGLVPGTREISII